MFSLHFWILHALFFVCGFGNAFKQIFNDCFNDTILAMKGPPSKNSFRVRSVDDFRFVDITFEVSGAERSLHCSMDWANGLIPKGKINSVHRETNGAIPSPYDVPSIDGIHMNIYRGNRARWNLVGLYPCNLVSGKFVRSLISQGLAELRRFLKLDYIPLVLFDHSTNREMYWLEKGKGLTYYEGVWNLEYECLIKLGEERYSEFRQISAQADKMLISQMFPHDSFGEFGDPTFHFDNLFKRWVFDYMGRIEQGNITNMTIREVLDEFLPLWRNANNYGEQTVRQLARNTFVYFFKNHLQFDMLCMQVLSGAYDDCRRMSGVPIDSTPYDFEFSYEARQTEQVGIDLSSNQRYYYEVIFTLSFIILIIYFLHRYATSNITNEILDFYAKLEETFEEV